MNSILNESNELIHLILIKFNEFMNLIIHLILNESNELIHLIWIEFNELMLLIVNECNEWMRIWLRKKKDRPGTAFQDRSGSIGVGFVLVIGAAFLLENGPRIATRIAVRRSLLLENGPRLGPARSAVGVQRCPLFALAFQDRVRRIGRYGSPRFHAVASTRHPFQDRYGIRRWLFIRLQQ